MKLFKSIMSLLAVVALTFSVQVSADDHKEKKDTKGQEMAAEKSKGKQGEKMKAEHAKAESDDEKAAESEESKKEKKDK